MSIYRLYNKQGYVSIPTQSCHLLSNQARLQLAACKLSGDTTMTLETLMMQPNYTQGIPGEGDE